jgi:hypothetical protein
MKTLPLLLTLLAFGSAAPATPAPLPNPALAPIEDVAGLSRMLLIGNSISIPHIVNQVGPLNPILTRQSLRDNERYFADYASCADDSG